MNFDFPSEKFYSDNKWDNISVDAKDLLKRIICKKETRLKIPQIFEHPWMQDL